MDAESLKRWRQVLIAYDCEPGETIQQYEDLEKNAAAVDWAGLAILIDFRPLLERISKIEMCARAQVCLSG